jgi:redox-sensitive bicupin YhaK (pirin superfamily)
METRSIKKVFKAQPVLEGAGVRLKRAMGYKEVPQFDPFLLLDDFRSDHPDDYVRGFPWHPHRGIETITYVLEGTVEHGDSLSNSGIISAGDVQWMTAGSGIVHQEMPKGDAHGAMYGFQLWSNLPSSHKMMDPRYREIKASEIPEIALDNGTKVKLICGSFQNTTGPAQDIVTQPEYLDITVPKNSTFKHATKNTHTVFAYVIDGRGIFCGERKPFAYQAEGINYFDFTREPFLSNETLVLFDTGDEIVVETGELPVRFLLIAGKPIGEPIAWYGTIVMNTQKELEIAFREYQNNTFVKHRKTGA